MNTAPAPNAAAPPGMCPGAVVQGGGGAGAGGGAGGGGSGAGAGGASGGGSGASGSGANGGAADPGAYPLCGTASHPVDVATGRAFTHPIVDFELGGPLPLRFERSASSHAHATDAGLGPSWSHTLGWHIQVRRSGLRVFTDLGTYVDFPLLKPGEEHLGEWGWVLQCHDWGYALDDDDGVWKLFSAARPDSGTWVLTALEDRNRNRIELTYAEDGRHLTEIRDSAGRVLRVKTDHRDHITAIEMKNAPSGGRWVALARYEYDEQGRLQKAFDADGYEAQYAYDDDGRFTWDKARDGLAFVFHYDKLGRCIESYGTYPDRGQRDPSVWQFPDRLHDGGPCKGIHHCRFDYGPGVTFVTDSTQTRNFFPNAHGTLDSFEEGGSVTQATYFPNGHLETLTDPEGGLSKYERDPRGRVTRFTDPLGRETQVERDAMGQPIRVTEPAGGITELYRDARGNLVRYVDPLGATTLYERDARGLVTKVTHPRGGVTTAQYDAEGNLVSVTMPNGGVWHYAYDVFGRQVSVTDPLGHQTHFVYSQRGDLMSVRDALGHVTRYGYDGERHLTQVVSPEGHITKMEWGGYHKLVRRTDANGHKVRLAYNVEGELTHVLNEIGEVHRLFYDMAGRLRGEDTFDGRQLRYRNDGVGRPVHIENGAGEVTELVYNPAGELVERLRHDGAVDQFAYSLNGELVGATTPECQVSFERDLAGQIVREVQVLDGVAHEVSTAWDPEGERTGRRTSLGHVEQVVRDIMGNRVQSDLDGHVVRHTPDALGRELRRDLPGGGALETTFDPLGRVAGRRAMKPVTGPTVGAGEPAWVGPTRGEVTAHKQYRYSPDGELVEAWDKDRGSTTFKYDPVGQLLAMLPPQAQSALQQPQQPAERFTYDPRGNIYEDGAGAPQRVYGPGNRLLRQGNVHFRWASATGPELHVTFTYDPFARRLDKQVFRADAPDTLVRHVRFVWDGDVLAHEVRREAAEAGDPVVEERTYLFEDDGFEPLAHREDEGWVHYANDPIGTPKTLVESRGAAKGTYIHTAWGTLAAQSSGSDTPLRLQGQYLDSESQLRYNRWRYVSSFGGFASPDPLGLATGHNFYSLFPNALGWVDPLGLEWNYRLRDSSGRVYYHGKAGDNVSPAKVMQRHRGNKIRSTGIPRMGPNDVMEQLTERYTEKDTVRGVEQLGSQRTCLDPTNHRGNVIRAAGPRNKKTPARIAAGRAHVADASSDGTVLGLPTLVTHNPNNPRATNARWRDRK